MSSRARCARASGDCARWARRSASCFWRLARNSSSSLVGEELVVVAGLGFRAVGVLVPLVGRVFLAVGAKDFGLAFVRPSLCWDVIAGLLGGHDVDVGWAAVLVGRVGWVKKMRIGVRGCCCVRSEVSAKVLRARPLLWRSFSEVSASEAAGGRCEVAAKFLGFVCFDVVYRILLGTKKKKAVVVPE